MSVFITIVCEASTTQSVCAERVHVTEQEIVTAMEHPDASPRDNQLDTARRIAAGRGWRTAYSADTGRFCDRCPVHSGTKRRPRGVRPLLGASPMPDQNRGNMNSLHVRSVDHFATRGERAALIGACPLETWARDLAAYVNERMGFLAAVHQLSSGEARGMALAGLVAGRPGSWEAAEVLALAREDFVALVEVAPDSATADLVGGWHTWQVDGGQVIADALARLAERGPVVPDASHFAQTSFALSTTA